MQEPHFKSFLLTYSFISASGHPPPLHTPLQGAFHLPWGFSWFFVAFFPLEDMLPSHFLGISRPGRGSRDPDKSASCLAGLDLALALDLALSWASRSGLAPAESSHPHPGFRWRHRPGSGLPFPLWASGPQLSLVSDFISSLIVDSSKSPSSICAWHRPGTSARAAAIGHGLRGGGDRLLGSLFHGAGERRVRAPWLGDIQMWAPAIQN